MGYAYNIFLRNWINARATEQHLDEAIARGFITEQEKVTIMEHEQEQPTE